MTSLPPGWRITVHGRIAAIGRDDWELCRLATGNTRTIKMLARSDDSRAPRLDLPDEQDDSPPEPLDSTHPLVDSLPQEDPDNPFISYDFLSALEVSGCVGAAAGWQPAHHALRDAEGHILAVVPAYVKSHSQGEYVFDHGWADAFMRAGGQYYPKLQIAVPFTPVTGPRLLIAAQTDRPAIVDALVAGLEATRTRLGASSIHATFLTNRDCGDLTERGYLLRQDRQFHWFNTGYGTFEDFLAALSARKRKMIRRERKDALAAGLTIRWLTSSDISEADWDAFYTFYIDTGSRKWGRPYLTRAFFSILGATMADRILLVFAERDGSPIAGAINFIGATTLFGRNWGAIEQHPFLHFELCYYQAMDFAIARRLATVEAGAQGEHKLLRGYRPVITRSAHSIAHEGLRRAVTDYLEHERVQVISEAIDLNGWVPFRKGG